MGGLLADLMAAGGWPGAAGWAARASGIAPTIVGGSKKHGGPDLGPTRARAAWQLLGVNGLGIADEPPGPDFPAGQLPKLTVRMVARLQGFPDWWEFAGRKTAAYRQVGNAFPPPVARALGAAISRRADPRRDPAASGPQVPGRGGPSRQPGWLGAAVSPARRRPARAALSQATLPSRPRVRGMRVRAPAWLVPVSGLRARVRRFLQKPGSASLAGTRRCCRTSPGGKRTWQS